MADFTPTPSQQAAITARGGAVLVAAAAGSGKTRVLTQRLMSYLSDEENPRDIDSFLVITFTRAAAAELRARIMQSIGRALAADPENRRLRRQSALCAAAQIGTIHSFCQSVLRENCHLLGLAPDFKVADETRAAAMRRTALSAVMDERYEDFSAHAGFKELADTVGAGRDDKRLCELVLNLHAKMQSHARPEKWAAEKIEELNLSGVTDAAETAWGGEILRHAFDTMSYHAEIFEEIIEDLRQAEDKLKKAYLAQFEDAARQLHTFCAASARGWDEAYNNFPLKFQRLGSVRSSSDEELSARVKSAWDACKRALKDAKGLFLADTGTVLADMEKTSVCMKALLELTLDFDAEYSRRKKRAALLDFSDLEHLTAKLLTDEDGSPTDLAKSLSARFTEILVDEYQDVSAVQDLIFRAASREGKNLFFVGDVKQSIYRFRLAEPEIFTRLYNTYAPDEASPGVPRRILLRENFRSRPEIINAVNQVFSVCMSDKLGELKYDDAAALRAGAEFPDRGQPPRVVLIDAHADPADERPDSTSVEAEAVANLIKSLLDSGEEITDGGITRPVAPGDIAILLRSANAVGEYYRRALEAAGVPVSSGQGGGFFESVEVSAAISALAVIDNPRQDVPLIALLRSPAVGFSADELTAIRARARDGDFYTALKASAAEDEKCAAFLARLNALRGAAPDTELSALILRVYFETDLMAVCSAMEGGARRRANLLTLLEYAAKFEETGARGLHRFVEWLNNLYKTGAEPPAAAPEGEAVTIMSVHRSKGLEFPVVFICDTARRFNRQDTRETVLVHPKLGLGPKVTDEQTRAEYPTVARLAIKLRTERESLSEELRLAYVAMTRAKERLYITAAVKDPADFIEKLTPAAKKPMPPQVLLQCAAPIYWYAYAVLAGNDELQFQAASPAELIPPAPEGEESPTPTADERIYESLRRNLAFKYPHAAAAALPSKVTATELKELLSPPDEEAVSLAPERPFDFRAPNFAAAETGDARARGTATHAVLQAIDLKNAMENGARAEIDRLVLSGELPEAEARRADTAAVEEFIKSPLAERMAQSPRVEREFRFSVLVAAEEFFPEGAGERILLQGAVDCFFEEEGGIVIIDYKTDRVRGEEIAARAQLYAPQLRAYKLAVETLTGLPVKETALYFLHPKRIITQKTP